MADLPDIFFKFIPPGFKHNLSIPSTFWTKLKAGKAILRRGNREWRVEISDGGVFGDGWRDFVTDNGIEELDFIVFDYKGKMVFELLVFDQSSCERPFPNLSHKMDAQKPFKESHPSPTHGLESKPINTDKKMFARTKGLTCGEENDRSYFIGKLKSYSINQSLLYLPDEFAKKNALIKKGELILINVEDETPWIVWLNHYKNKYAYINKGWKEFRIANRLKEGDCYKLELAKIGEVQVLNFYNLGPKVIKNHMRVTKKTNLTIKMAPSSTLNNHSYFISTLKPYSVKESIMYLPREFWRSNGLKIGKMILRDDKNRSWKVSLKERVGREIYLGCGFKAFRIANELKEGDAFKLELVENKKGKTPVVDFSHMII